MPDDRAPASAMAVGSVDHALSLLLMLRTAPALRVTAAARELGVSPSTVHRLLTTLASRGFVTQDRVTKEYRAGPSIFALGSQTTTASLLREVSEPHLKAQAKSMGETISLVVLQGDAVQFVAGFESDQRVRTHVLTGTALPAYATSGGKVLLAELSRGELRGLYPRGLRKLTPHTRTFTQLLDELSLVMMRGYALNEQESVEGLSALAVPLRDRAGRAIAAVALSAPTGRLRPARIREIVVALNQTSGRIREGLLK